ncbi:to aromatic and neutral aliphatic amino acid permease [Geosmithia morbida]|uniref:To aromatic and neutral aliphatic amino acid permease n=1 Tax=Geosmithia morbida TaxID=1094350 RepID=A0A9P4YQX2_9HYPO|nr:to aromatic and neutral aliphatic amino acid permease [Geosmithia morbida]KAF4120415.1 to aromatic and neutral aliphatic amino acid permease [Geosmithia morbida]
MGNFDKEAIQGQDDGKAMVGNVSAGSDVDEAPLINYRTLSWWHGGIILIAETVSLGILSLPSVIATLGLAPGIVLILVMSAVSTYSCVVLGEFRKNYPHAENFGDAAEIITRSTGIGPFFRELFGWAQVVLQVFVAGSHLLTWTICLNTLTNSSTCTIIWAVVGLGVFWLLNTPRTLKYTSWMSYVSCISIIVATLMTVGDVAHARTVTSGSFDVSRSLPFPTAFLAVANIAVSFSSHSCFFGVISEFKNENDWPKALALLQITDTTLYLIAAIVIYIFVGRDVPSPALSAAQSETMRKAIWGVAIPTIVIAGVIYGHVASKYIFDRIYRGKKGAVRRTTSSTLAWFGITFGVWLIAMIIAESIPVFNSLLGVICALFVSWFSYGLPGIFWLWMHYGNWFNKGPKQMARFAGNAVLLLLGVLLFGLGLWSSIDALVKEKTGSPWTCASNVA